MLSRLRIGPKLLLAPAIVVLLLVLLSAIAWYAMARQQQSIEDIVGQRAAHMRAASELVIGAQRAHAQVYQLHAWIGGSFAAHRIAPLLAEIDRGHALTSAGLDGLGRRTRPGSAERDHVDGAAAAHAAYLRTVRDVIELARDDQSISANAMGRAENAFAVVAGRLNGLSQLEGRLSQAAAERAAADLRTMRILVPGVILLAVAFSLAITLAVRRTLLVEIRGIGAAAAGLASGNLSVADGVAGNDEIAETSRALNAGIRNLSGTLRTVLDSARSIGAASRDLALDNLNLCTRASFRASSLEQTSSSMQELAANVHLTADSAEAANRLAASASHAARQGEVVVEHLLATLASVRERTLQVAQAGVRIDAMATESAALKGPGEAAAAARALALRAAVAAREIRELTAAAIGGIEGGSAWAAQAGSSIAALSLSVRQVGDIVSRISSASAQQAGGLHDVNEAIVQMDQVTQRNSALVEEAAESARSLQTQALMLSRAVAAFRLDEAAAAPAPPLSSRADVDLRDILKDGRRDASQPGPGEPRKGARGHLRLASSRD